jgi:hypothetical protein
MPAWRSLNRSSKHQGVPHGVACDDGRPRRIAFFACVDVGGRVFFQNAVEHFDQNSTADRAELRTHGAETEGGLSEWQTETVAAQQV